MLDYQRMLKSPLTLMALVGLACLFSILPTSNGFASSLREEAVSYRAQGYDLQRRGDTAGALSFYQKAAALDPSYPAPYNDIGVILEEQGRLEEAERSYLHALSMSPNYLEAHANVAMLYQRLGNKEKAIYHWLKRYELGDPHDPWTARAEEQLVALGVLTTYPGLKGSIYTRRRIIDQELESHAKSLEEFRSVTQGHGDWP